MSVVSILICPWVFVVSYKFDMKHPKLCEGHHPKRCILRKWRCSKNIWIIPYIHLNWKLLQARGLIMIFVVYFIYRLKSLNALSIWWLVSKTSKITNKIIGKNSIQFLPIKLIIANNCRRRSTCWSLISNFWTLSDFDGNQLGRMMGGIFTQLQSISHFCSVCCIGHSAILLKISFKV